jgi:hypothetical protein
MMATIKIFTTLPWICIAGRISVVTHKATALMRILKISFISSSLFFCQSRFSIGALILYWSWRACFFAGVFSMPIDQDIKS